MPVSLLKGPAKKAGVSLNDWVLGCATQAVGLLGGDKEKGHYVGIQFPMALHKASEINEYPPKIWNGLTMPNIQVMVKNTVEDNANEIKQHTDIYK